MNDRSVRVCVCVTNETCVTQANQKSLQQSPANDDARDTKPLSQPQSARDNGLSTADQHARACQLAEYLQRKTKLQMSGVEIGLDTHQCSQRTVMLTTTLKLIGNCVDDVISWAKAIPGETEFHDSL